MSNRTAHLQNISPAAIARIADIAPDCHILTKGVRVTLTPKHGTAADLALVAPDLMAAGFVPEARYKILSRYNTITIIRTLA